jgi:hypothetical protein
METIVQAFMIGSCIMLIWLCHDCRVGSGPVECAWPQTQLEQIGESCANLAAAGVRVGDRFPRGTRYSLTIRHVPLAVQRNADD